MKSSKYNVFATSEDKKELLYNTLSRKYVILEEDNKSIAQSILDNPNSTELEYGHGVIKNKLISKNILIQDDIDELSYIEFEENKVRFQDQQFNLIIQPTLDCNFRCVYCYENHQKIKMDDKTASNILKLVEDITKKVNVLKLAWFGGEPLLGIARIKELTEEIVSICRRNGCKYIATMTTNGYLFTDELIDNIEALEIRYLQITLDGCSEQHNSKRPLENGEGTFDRIKENIVKLSYKNVVINFRINIDDQNYDHIEEIFDIVPEDNRYKINIVICNLFQNSDKINVYALYKKSIEKGYPYKNTKNSFKQCELCSKNGMVIEPNGRIVPCSLTAEKGYSFGYLNDNGKFILENKAFYYKLKTISALKSERCRTCIKLPMCMGKCKFSRYIDNNVCNDTIPDGLTLSERVKLHYYSDIKQNNIKEADYI